MEKWKGVIILIIIAAMVTWGLLHLSEIVNAVQGTYSAWKTHRQIEALEKPYRTDKIGGQTPEETFDLFISALKKGDIDLASKYFILQKQESWRKTLDKYEDSQIMGDFIGELEKEKSEWRKQITKSPEVVEFYTYTTIRTDTQADFNGHKIPIEAGKYLNTTRFEKYPTGVWKIDLL